MPKRLAIFVSYASEDAEAVTLLDSWLKEQGFDPWIDKRSLIPGQDWALEIPRAVTKSDIVLVCLSRKSVEKTGYVQKEIRVALDAADQRPHGNIFLIPVRLDDCAVPERLQHLHCVDLFRPEGHERLARALDHEKSKITVQANIENEGALASTSRRETVEQIHEFVRQTGQRDIVRVIVISHTGGVTLNALLDALNEWSKGSLSDQPIKLQVLLRSPQLSDLGRAQSISRSIESLRNFAASARLFDVEARYYAAPPLLRCLIFERRDGTCSAYLSFYDWPLVQGLNQRGAANRSSFVHGSLTSDHLLLDTFVSWFNHLWGIHRVHMLLFDFDDTLFLTTDCQVKGWIEALTTAIDGKTFATSEFAQDIRRQIERRVDLTALMTRIFLDEQQEQDILQRIFVKLPPLNKLELLRKHRVRVREELTALNAMPIPQIIGDIKSLSAEYQIAIVSATSEILVRQVLERHGLENLFAYIIGREAPRQPWQAVESKTQQFLRISNIVGIPLERMIFVGDSDADYRSAAQVGLHFVENRYNAKIHGRESLVKSLDPVGRRFLSGKEGELISAVKAIEAKLGRLP